MNSIKGIIFDYGGTIDTNGIHWAEIIWQQYRKADVNVGYETYRNAYVHGERTLARQRIILSTDTFRTLLHKKIEIQFSYLACECNVCGLTEDLKTIVAEGCYAKVKETLSTTCAIVEKLSGKYPLVLVTNFYGNMPVVLEEFNLSGYFKSIVESSVVGLRKPDPALYALGVKELGIPAENIMVIGDSYRKDIYPAREIGCQAVWLKNVCWEEEPVESGHEPTHVIDTLEKLNGII